MLAGDIPMIPELSEQYLNPRQRLDYKESRTDFLEWRSVFGKDSDRAEGYAHPVVKNTAHRTEQFSNLSAKATARNGGLRWLPIAFSHM